MTRRLGRGFAEIVESAVQSNPSLLMIPSNQIKPGRFQPRESIDEQTLEDLKRSIKDRGIIQPVIVRPISHGVYELVAGERRWRAAQALGIQEVPAIVRALSDQEALEYSLIENLQRHNLNPIEEALGFTRLMNEFQYTQEQVAEKIGKDRSTIANTIRLLKLPIEVQSALRQGKITQGHARAILGVEQVERQLALLQETMEKALSVRQIETLVSNWRPTMRRKRQPDESRRRAKKIRIRQA